MSVQNPQSKVVKVLILPTKTWQKYSLPFVDFEHFISQWKKTEAMWNTNRRQILFYAKSY